MKKNNKNSISVILAIVLLSFFAPLFTPLAIFAAPEVHAQAHILIEPATGRVISENNAHRRMFPAATTMVLTAILAYEHIGMDEIIIAGPEVNMLPPTSGRNNHEIGEAITGENLLRGMLIGAGNDTSNIIAIEVARRLTGENDIEFTQAQIFFANLMTERAQELGALDSHFMNSHGFHHDSHFTTAYDMAQIARHALTIPDIMRIASEGSFSGPMAGGNDVPDGALAFSRTWNSPNELLHAGAFFYPYATGLRTGRTNQAGDSLAASAYRDGISLISITFNSPEINNTPTRWQDNINLFEYGFANYDFHMFSEAGIAGQMYIYEPALDDAGYLELFSTETASEFLSITELENLERYIEILPEFLIDVFDEEVNEYVQMLLAPIEENTEVGHLHYKLGDEIIFETPLYAARYVPQRTTARDINHYRALITGIFFTQAAVPYWIAAGAVSLLLMVLIILARNAIRRKNKHNKYRWKV